MKKFNLQEWLEFHKFASNLYAYPYDEQLQIYNINRNATAVAPFEVWSNIGLRINGGTRSMTIYDKNGIKKHLFDVSQTNGKDIKPWKYNVSYNEYIFDMLDKMYEKNGSETRADRGEKTFHNNIYDYVFESVYSHPKSPTGQLSTELCELIAETVTYTVCERLNVIEEQYKYDFSNFSVINENAQELVGTVAAVYVNVFCRTAKQLVKTVSLEEAQGRQAMRKPIVNDDISEFEQKVTVEETTVTDNADIETENDISEKEDDRYVVEPDDTVEPEPDYNEFVEVPEKAEHLTLTAEQQETVLKQIFQADYKKVNKQAVIKFYNINKSAKVLMRYTYAVYKGSHPIELAEMPDVVKWSATSKGVVFADANGAELYCVNWRTACGYVKQLIRDNEYAINNTIEATSEKEEKETEKYRGNIISASTMKQQRLYSKFVELFPDFLTDYKYLKLESDLGFMTLSLDKIGSNSVAMAHYYEQNGDLMVDPEIVFDIDSKNKTLTAVSYQQDGMGIYKTYEPDSDEQLGIGGPKQKFNRNVTAIQLLKKIEEENRNITKDEQQVLSEYVGWGGIPEAFDKNNSSWSQEYEQLKNLLTEEEYQNAIGSVLNAHYTQPVVINAMYTALSELGFSGGKILEPAAGVGNFIGCAPENIADRSFFTAVEIDSISGRIAKQLYPESEVQVCGYENAKLRAGTFDVAVGNVPFGDYSVVDKKYNRDHAMIHDYFFLKTLEMVRPNGVIAFITSKGTMDKQSSKIRKQIDEKAEFIGAIRLPNTAFKATAGTTVVSDIIFLKKRSFPQTKLSEWVDTAYNEDGQRINQYFINHPEMICGELKIKSGPYGPEMTVDPFSDKSLKDALSECVENLVNNTDVRYTQLSLRPVAAEADDTQKQEEALPAPENIPDGFYVSINDNIYKRNGSVLVEAKRKSGKAFTEREKGMLTLAIDLAKDLRYAVNIQNTDISDEDYEKIRISLESKYNYFSVKYGKITDPNNKLVYNTLRYVRDDNLDFLKSIETPKFEKSDILLKRTIRPSIKITHCDTVEDGFQATLAEYGYIDLNHISKITGYKVDECINRLNGILMYRDPDELFSADIQRTDGWLTADEYLSGNVVEKLRKAKLLSSRFPELKVNVEALEKVQPEKIKAVDILAQIGSSWIPEKYIEQFVEEVFGIGTVVEHNTATANWKLSNKVNGNYHSSTSTEYGTADINAMYILENSLNLRDSTVWRDKRDELGHLVYDDKGNKVREKDVEKTIAANHKAEKIKETFKEWVWTDAYRTQDLENIYNAKYNTERARTYDGSHLFFAGMTSSIQLADHQKNAVARVLYGGNTLLAHVVGAGKTFEMTAAAMEMRRIGAANKPLFIVPNHLIGQWGKEFLTLYPDANILLATSEDFEKSRRKAFVNRIATGDYDAVIMGYSTFAKISISPEKRKEYYQQQIDELIDIIQSSDDDDNLSVKDAQKKKKQLETRLKNLEYDTEQDDNIYFENLGVDALFVDEAHNFKNLSINTKLSRIAGIQTTESKRSEDLLLKIQYIKEKQNGLDRGIVFATGTPISNSLTEMYVMKKYLEPDYLREKGLQHFDSWVSDFAEVTTNIELSPTGNSWRAKKRCSTFKNLPELMSIYRRVADIQTAETLKLPVPKLKNGKYTICLTKPSEEQKLFIFDCGERAEEVHQKRVDPSKDNMLKITNDGKMCALDMRLVDPTVEDNPDSKVNMAVNNIFNKWEETKDDSLTQVVFLDRSTPSKGFNLYDDIKSKLIALGVPEEEIKFIHDAKNDKEKVKLFEDVNEGRVRILIGSTEKMGAGTNIQKKLCALHHIDVPWRPSDIEQREGRILRQGNDCKEVEIFRYATEGTFDSYSWQTIEYKQKFISQVMTNKPLGRSIDDVDEAALNYAEIKSLATGDPRIKRQLELSTQVDNLRREKAEFEADRMRAREEITFTIPTQIKRAEKFIEIFDNAVEYSKQYPRSENFCVEIVDNKITDREEAGKAVKALRKVGGEEPIDVCDYRGFKIQIQYSSLGGYGSFKTIVSHENATLFTSLGVSNTDVFDNIDNAIDVDMPQLLSIHKEELEIAQKNMQKSKEIAEREFPKLKEYQEKREELNKLTSEIGLNDNSGDMDIVFKQDAVTSVIDKSYIRDNSGTIIAKFTYSVPESYIEKIYNDDDNLSLEYGSLQEYVKSVQGDNRFYEKSKKARKIVDDDIPAVDDTMFLTLKQCRAIVLEEDSELLTLQGVKSNGEHIKVGTFDYDYQTYQTLSSVGKLYSEKLGIPFGDEDIAASRNRGI